MIPIQRTDIEIVPDKSRVLLRPFQIAEEARIHSILQRVLRLSDAEVDAEVVHTVEDFESRHRNTTDYFESRCEAVRDFLPSGTILSPNRRLLIGACFTMEYALEAAALFNPSMVWHPDQSNMPFGSRRFVFSLRATGEGHLSSIVFRSGVVDEHMQITMEPTNRFVTTSERSPDLLFEKPLFLQKLHELEMNSAFVEDALAPLPDMFSKEMLETRLRTIKEQMPGTARENAKAERAMNVLAFANYEMHYAPDIALSERVIFPHSSSDAGGIEDARFVQFTEEDGRTHYYATYTAYDRRVTYPQILETPDFLHFKMNTLNGPEVMNKGMALFPRRINGQYAMLSRQDGENIYIMFSDAINFWYEKHLLLQPKYPWELMLMGNCGSPMETQAGWLVLSHGVGTMRRYSMGAFLLDLNDPTKVIGRLPHPLLTSNETEREGYVPNVVYSCGAQIHNGTLILPYGSSDSASHIATVPVDALLGAMQPE